MKTVNALVIFCTLLGKKKYISSKSTRADNKYIVEYAKDVEQAIPFVTEQEAQQFISKIHNPHNREFQTEPALVPSASIAPAKLPKEKIT